MAQIPAITYIYDMPSDHITSFWSDALIDDLARSQVRLCIAIRDTSPARTLLIQRLNVAKIPVVAWLVRDDLDVMRDYRMGDANDLHARYRDVMRWSTTNALRWDAVGIDISADVRDTVRFGDKPAVDVNTFLKRISNRWHIDAATTSYENLLALIRADGHRIESYEIPFVRDDRVSGSTLARRLLGLPAIAADAVVVRLYSSHARPYGPGLIAAYAPECAAVAIGDFAPDGSNQPLSEYELWRDLQHISGCGVAHVYIAGLPTIIEQNWHTAIIAGGWVRRTLPPTDEVHHQIARMRAGMRALLWAGARPSVLLPLLIPVLMLVRRMVRGHEDQTTSATNESTRW
ncbi:MAG: hypothetical protein RLY87_2287 [Chloroflexota bacterium]|jgi:hypothetical protein